MRYIAWSISFILLASNSYIVVRVWSSSGVVEWERNCLLQLQETGKLITLCLGNLVVPVWKPALLGGGSLWGAQEQEVPWSSSAEKLQVEQWRHKCKLHFLLHQSMEGRGIIEGRWICSWREKKALQNNAFYYSILKILELCLEVWPEVWSGLGCPGVDGSQQNHFSSWGD